MTTINEASSSDYHNEISAELDRLKAALEVALEAIRPFEKEAVRYDKLVLGEDIDDWKITTTELTLGDLRKARAAIAAIQEALSHEP